jgi:hypothetical protein
MKNFSRKTILASLVSFALLALLAAFIGGDAIRAEADLAASKSGRFISAYGDLNVIVTDDFGSSSERPAASSTVYEVVIDGSVYPAVVPADTRRKYSKRNIPLAGTLADGKFILDENPFKIIAPTEYADRNVDAGRIGEAGVASEIGGRVEYFPTRPAFEKRLREQLQAEAKIGPDQSPEAAARPWTEGVKTVLFIRIDFSDAPGGVGTEQQTLDMMNNQVNPFFAANSYNKASFQTTVTPVLRMPKPRTHYAQAPNTQIILQEDARIVASEAGFDTNQFNLDVVSYGQPFTNFCGGRSCALVGAKGMWLDVNGYVWWAVAHELGHNFGLFHATLWTPTDGSPIGTGSAVDYGDAYDLMGLGSDSGKHFNGSYKRALDWLTDANVRTVTTDGIYRIYAHDIASEGGIRALKIGKDNTKDYWITKRQLSGNSYLYDGAQFHWKYFGGNTYSALLDMNTPGDYLADHPLQPGQTFYDGQTRTKFSVMNTGTPPETVDVKVEFSVGCTYSLVSSSQSFPAAGGIGYIVLNTQSGCLPTVNDNGKWVQIVQARKGAGLASVDFIVMPNFGAARTAAINVAGQIFTVNQSAVATACVAAPAGIVAWWRGEGNALDETGRNGGVLRNPTATISGGLIGGAFRTGDFVDYFSFGQIAYVPDSPSLALTNSLTIEGWIRLNAFDSYVQGSVIRRATIDSSSPAYAVDIIDRRPRFVINSASNSSTPVSVLGPQMFFGELVHFAAVLDADAGTMKIYINGEVADQKQTAARPYANLPAGGAVWIGDRSSTVDYSIDELTVYNRSLSTSEIQNIYNAGTASADAAGKCPFSHVQATPFDFDGDRRADLSVYARPGAQASWQVLGSQASYSAYPFGLNTDKIAPADYDNDGRTDYGVFRNGVWYMQLSGGGYGQLQWGATGDVPQAADFTGDGRIDLGVWRPSNGTWYVLDLNNYQYSIVQWGQSGDKPVAGDYDGDGAADFAVYRPSNGVWYLLQSTAGSGGLQFGVAEDLTVPADYDGDGKTDVAVFRPSTASWYILRTGDWGVTARQIGQGTDFPAPADYDGDGKTDIALWKPGAGMRRGEWLIVQSHDNQTRLEYFGEPTDVSAPSAFTNLSY